MTARNRMSMYIQQYIHKQIKYKSKKDILIRCPFTDLFHTTSIILSLYLIYHMFRYADFFFLPEFHLRQSIFPTPPHLRIHH